MALKRDYVFGVVDEYAAPGKFMIDYDRPSPPRLRAIYAVFGSLRLKIRAVMYRRTARGWHVIVWAKRPYLSPAATIAVELILGSDRRRAKFDLRRALRLRGLGPFARARYQVLFREKL